MKLETKMVLGALAVSVAVSAAPALATAATWDLASNWSDSVNPNGPWSLNQGTTPLPSVQNFSFGGTAAISQPAWAPSNTSGNFLPAFFKAQTTVQGLDWAVGDVVMHSTDTANGGGSGIANVSWTSPISGAVSVSGNLWEIRDIGRSNTWTLRDGTSVIATNTLVDGDGHTSANRDSFSITNIAVTPGTVLTLSIAQGDRSPYGELSGLNFTVVGTPTSVPEPSAWAFLLMGVGLTGGAMRQRRRFEGNPQERSRSAP
jgi:hypothetical protein